MSRKGETELEKFKRREARNLRAAHARGLMQGILSMLKPGDVVFDCGANIGDVSEPLAATGATVHAFEPDPFAFGKLTKRLAGADNATLHNVAVGVAAGEIGLMRAENFEANPKGASVKSTVVAGGRAIDEADDNVITVPLIDLPAMLEQVLADRGEIALLKMDIEGAELDILEEMERRDLYKAIRLTVVETHERKFKALRPRFAALRERTEAAYPITKVNLDWI